MNLQVFVDLYRFFLSKLKVAVFWHMISILFIIFIE